MSEKRFEIMDGIDKDRYVGIWDEHGKNDELCVSEVVNLLNSLTDENEQLKLKNHELEEKVYDLLEDKQALMNFIRERFPKDYETIFEEIQVH